MKRIDWIVYGGGMLAFSWLMAYAIYYGFLI